MTFCSLLSIPLLPLVSDSLTRWQGCHSDRRSNGIRRWSALPHGMPAWESILSWARYITRSTVVTHISGDYRCLKGIRTLTSNLRMAPSRHENTCAQLLWQALSLAIQSRSLDTYFSQSQYSWIAHVLCCVCWLILPFGRSMLNEILNANDLTRYVTFLCNSIQFNLI